MKSPTPPHEKAHSPHLDTSISHSTTVGPMSSSPNSPRSERHDTGSSAHRKRTLHEKVFGHQRVRYEKGWLRRELFHLVGEFLGTFLFLFIAYLTAQAAIGNDPSGVAGGPLSPATLFYVAVGFGGGVLVSLLIFKGLSGEMFNPAVRTPVFFFLFFIHASRAVSNSGH